MRSTTLGLLAFSLLLLTTSCASIVGKRNANVLEIRSEPPGATVSINGAEVGNTPYTLTYSKELDREVLVELRMEGYEPVNSTVRVKEQGGIIFADAMLLGIPYIFDSRDPRLYKFQAGRLDL